MFSKEKWSEAFGSYGQIIHYCQYQERCHAEVRNKLYEMGATTPEVENIIVSLIERDFLNEERFARSYSRGKFRIKGWGRNKIKYQLKTLKISEYCINKGFLEIDYDEYLLKLRNIADKKWILLRTEKNQYKKQGKLRNYLNSKGYESDLIMEVIKSLLSAE